MKNETVSASDDVTNEVEEEVLTLSEKPIPLWATFDPNEVIFQISYRQKFDLDVLLLGQIIDKIVFFL